MKMPKATRKSEIKVKINIQPGPASQTQKTALRKFWQKLIATAREELENEVTNG